ncbi:hypothetical protein L1987_78126 [Smallanthus sonchifolius]|uniref:Uncharacterized protein n=1 Tax=Smallanthus sonchifolius TaxID=185202 RepID=A0ACB8ZC11_9ASTR|nr:hypothetical protein L1987_78126 [Smallanthus sonchifolius]
MLLLFVHFASISGSSKNGVFSPTSRLMAMSARSEMKVTCQAAADHVPAMERRKLMHLLLFGALTLPAAGMLLPYSDFFPLKGGGTIAKYEVGNSIIASEWLKTHGPGEKTLTLGLKGDPAYLMVENKWNTVEKKFICPCHGSGYNNQGTVIKGPARLRQIYYSLGKEEEDMTGEIENRRINEEHKIWKKNTPFLYDLVQLPLEDDAHHHDVDDRSDFGGFVPPMASGSDDAQICLWDINGTPKNKSLDAMHIMAHDGVVEDVAWHLRHEYLFGSCGDDRYLHIWDIRSPSATKSAQSVIAHQSEVNCLAFNPFNEWVLATGSTDKTVKLFDLRKLNPALQTFDFHREEVFQVGWNPQNDTILGSCCLGRRIMVWEFELEFKCKETSRGGKTGASVELGSGVTTGLARNKRLTMLKRGHPSCCLSMVDMQVKFRISHGIHVMTGWLLALMITYFKSGR